MAEEILDFSQKSEETVFLELKKGVKKLLGFDSEQYSDNFLKRRVMARMRANKASGYAQYLKIFSESKKEQNELLRNLTIHVTEFFRDESFWEFCREKFFKDAILKLTKNDFINIWSAGCSSGQEPISIMITFLEIDKKLKDKIRIFATDISDETLDKAKSFLYEKNFEIKGLRNEIIDKYFAKKSDCIELNEEYRQIITYLKHDILVEPPLKNIDMLFLRNTVIYFTKESKERLYAKIYQSLNTPSFFILGKTETLGGPARELFKIYDPHERVFLKPE